MRQSCHRRLLRRGHLHRQLPGGIPPSAGRRHRPGARLGPSLRQGVDRLGRQHARQGARARRQIDWVLETHAHADHLTAAPHLKAKTGAQVAIGEHIKDVQKIFSPVFDACDLSGEGREFDRLLQRRRALAARRLRSRSCICPATRRRTSPTGSAMRCSSATRSSCPTTAPPAPTSPAATPSALSLDPPAAVVAGRDAPFHVPRLQGAGPRRYAWETTVGERAGGKCMCGTASTRALRRHPHRRDARLAAPVLLLPSVQVNIRAGRFPRPMRTACSYLRIPVRLAA